MSAWGIASLAIERSIHSIASCVRILHRERGREHAVLTIVTLTASGLSAIVARGRLARRGAAKTALPFHVKSVHYGWRFVVQVRHGFKVASRNRTCADANALPYWRGIAHSNQIWRR